MLAFFKPLLVTHDNDPPARASHTASPRAKGWQGRLLPLMRGAAKSHGRGACARDGKNRGPSAVGHSSGKRVFSLSFATVSFPYLLSELELEDSEMAEKLMPMRR